MPTLFELAVLDVILGMQLLGGSNALVPFEWGMLVVATGITALMIVALRFGLLALALFDGVASWLTWMGRAWTRWVHLGLILVLFAVIHFTPWLFALHVWMMEDELRFNVAKIQEREALNQTVHHYQPRLIASIVWLPEINVEERGKIIIFRTVEGTAPWGGRADYLAGGLLYCEEGTPNRLPYTYDYAHLFGPWWRYRNYD